MALMSQQRLSFMKFIDDCVIHCIANRGLAYQPLHPAEVYTVYFTANYGDAVLRYRGANEDNYRMCIRRKTKNENFTYHRLQDYMLDGIRNCFHETEKKEGILKYCSLYTDTAIYCSLYDRMDFINQALVATANFVFECHVSSLFLEATPDTVVDIWNDILQAGINLVDREIPAA